MPHPGARKAVGFCAEEYAASLKCEPGAGRAAGWVLTGRGPGLERNPTSTSFSNMNQQTRLECQQLFDVYKACKKAHRERVIQERLDARGGSRW